jgi:recombination protein RecA
VNIDELEVSQPDNGEQALEIAESLVRSGAVDVVVVDSVAALTPQAEIEGNMGDAQMGLQARLMSQAMRKLTAIIAKSRTVLIFINQIRMKIGVMFGNPETTTGGNALKFYSSVRIDVRKFEVIEGKEEAIGNRVKIKVVKNKVAPPFRKAEMDIMFGKGISWTGSLLDAAVKYEIIDKKGAWFSYGEDKIGQGRDSAKEYIEQNPAFAAEIEEKVRRLIFPWKYEENVHANRSAASDKKTASPIDAKPAVQPAAANNVAPIKSAPQSGLANQSAEIAKNRGRPVSRPGPETQPDDIVKNDEEALF